MPIIDCIIGENVNIWYSGHYVNLYGSSIGDNTTIGCFVEIGNAIVGKNCKIGTQAYICPGTKIGDFCFIAHGARFCNVKFPKANISQRDNLKGSTVEDYATIGAGAIILPNLVIGRNSFVGAGSVVIHDVEPDTIVAGNPAKVIASREQRAWIERYRIVNPEEVLQHWDNFQEVKDFKKT